MRASVRRRVGDRATSIEQLVAAKEIVVTCGSGGVGKTTTAAALGTMAADAIGGRVLVLTVDPARRLANAMGLEAFGNAETLVEKTTRGELWAAMLDTKASWDDLVRQHAPDARTRDAILANPLYKNITGKFVQSHDYIAMERLYELHSSGAWDLICGGCSCRTAAGWSTPPPGPSTRWPTASSGPPSCRTSPTSSSSSSRCTTASWPGPAPWSGCSATAAPPSWW